MRKTPNANENGEKSKAQHTYTLTHTQTHTHTCIHTQMNSVFQETVNTEGKNYIINKKIIIVIYL